MTSEIRWGGGDRLPPPGIIDAARKIMGGISIDPCSSKEANRLIVGADYAWGREGKRLLTEIISGRGWCDLSRVWCAPQENPMWWFNSLHDLWLEGDIDSLFFLLIDPPPRPDDLDFPGIPRLETNLDYWNYNEITGNFQEGNWAIFDQNEEDPKPVITACLSPATDDSWLSLFDEQGKFLGATPDIEKSWERWKERHGDRALRKWVHGDRHKSTLLYFPLDVFSSEPIRELNEAFDPSLGRWIIP